MREHREKPAKPEVAEVGKSFPLPLSRTAPNRTVLWAIAGFDPSSGAGVTADLMTFAAHGAFGCSVITALTVQSTRGVRGWEAVRPETVSATLTCLEEDLPFAGAKIGMLGTPAVATAVARFLEQIRGEEQRRGAPIVFDPVLRSSSGRELFPESGIGALRRELLPWVDWITPNWAELALLANAPVETLDQAEAAARNLINLYSGLHVVATGGDQGDVTDLLVGPDGLAEVFRGERVETRGTHGTGCAFSSALLCELVSGAAPEDAVRRAKRYVEQALRSAPGLGAGRGPMGLLWPLERSAQQA